MDNVPVAQIEVQTRTFFDYGNNFQNETAIQTRF